MNIENRLFSENTEEVLYSVLLDEEEYNLYSEFNEMVSNSVKPGRISKRTRSLAPTDRIMDRTSTQKQPIFVPSRPIPNKELPISQRKPIVAKKAFNRPLKPSQKPSGLSRMFQMYRQIGKKVVKTASKLIK